MLVPESVQLVVREPPRHVQECMILGQIIPYVSMLGIKLKVLGIADPG